MKPVALLEKHKSRLLAYGILLAALALALLGIVWPIASILGEPQEAIAKSTRLLASYRAAAAERPALEQILRDVRVRAASAPILVQGNSSALAAAQMQSEIKTIVEGLGGSVHTSQNLPTKASGNFEEIPLSYALSIPADKLAELLYRLEARQPNYVLSDVHIWVPETQSGPGVAPELQFTVTAVRWAGAR